MKLTYERFVIGIDCGRNTGIAIWDREANKFISLQTFSCQAFIDYMYRGKGEIFRNPETRGFLVVEDTNLNKPFFMSKMTGVSAKNRNALMCSMAQKVGRNQESAVITLGMLEILGFKIVKIKPKTKKWDTTYVSTLYPYLGQTNEHTRDAIKLVREYLENAI